MSDELMEEQEEGKPVRQAGKPKTERAPYVLGGIILAVYFGIALLLIFVDIQQGSQAAVHELTTTLRDAFMVFIMWMYGTTKNSARKDEMLHQSTPINPHS